MKAFITRIQAILVIIFFVFACSKEETKPTSAATPTTGVVASITTNSASLQVTLGITGTVTVDSKGVCWSLGQNPTTNDSKTNEGPGTNNFTSQLTGLTSNTTYFVRSYITSTGKTTYGNQVSFKTLESLNITLTTSSASSITSTTATSGGSMVTRGIGSVIAKGVCWSKSQNPSLADSKTTNGSGTDSYTSSLTNLEGNTVYYVRAYATDDKNVTTYGNQVSFTTLQGFTVTLQTTAITSVTVTSASSGGTITTTGTGGTISSRGVCWATTTNPTIANSKTSNGSGTGIFTSSITGLVGDTKYFVRAYATDNSGVTTYGNEVSFTSGTLSLDGTWKIDGTGISVMTIQISGSNSSMVSIVPNRPYQAAVDQGFASLTTPHLRNISKTSSNWTCERFSFHFTENLTTGTITINKAGYISGTITMSSDGKTITVNATVPSGQGWPSGVVGTTFSNTWTRQ